MKRMTLLLMSLALAGCATAKTPSPVSGSKADGTVELAYEVGMLEVAEVNWEEARAKAQARCAAWNYSAAEPFGAAQQNCVAYDGYGGCVRHRVTRTYQCID